MASLTNTRGIFALFDVRVRQNSGSWRPLPYDKYGYFGGGTPGSGSFSTVDRIDYSNDTSTASPRGPLSAARRYLAATGNSSYGWFGGGNIPGAVSTVDRIDYSNDTATASLRGPLSLNKYTFSTVGNNSYGWSGGGRTEPPSNTYISLVDRIDYSNDTTTASPRGPLSVSRGATGSTGNSSYGWFGAGYTAAGGVHYSTVDRIDYSNDTATSSPRGVLTLARHQLAATGNSSYGWFGGGYAPSSYRSTVDRIDYSNDTVAASPKGSLTSAKGYLAATGNSSYGYFGGGTSPTVSTVDRIDYSNDTSTASPRGVLSTAKYGLAATSASANAVNVPRPNIPAQVRPFGYFGGGQTPAGPRVSTVDRIDYSNDTVAASPKGLLSLVRADLAATGNSSYGWFGGGRDSTPSIVSRVDRIDYSNDTATASIRGTLSITNILMDATGNYNYGYFGGGVTGPTVVSTVDRIDYSNDTVAASPRGVLTLARYGLAATGNISYGWFGGGTTPAPSTVATVDRVDYSNDTATASLRGPLSLSAVRYNLAATGNSSYGWFGGGYAVFPTPTIFYSRVDRIDYSNDTATASPRGPLSLARGSLAATGNSSYGWFGGGTPGPIFYSSVDRIDYSNDTVAASPRGPLSVARSGLAGTSPTINGFPQ